MTTNSNIDRRATATARTAAGLRSATYHGADLGSWRFDCISDRRTLNEGKQAATWRR